MLKNRSASARQPAEALSRKISSFRSIVWAHYRAYGRHDLPWRKTHDPYKILVSEVMLQQTQVERVIPFYKKFIKRFPTAKKLSAAPLSEVLKEWQGLGYNRRAKLLHEAAKQWTMLPNLAYRTDLVTPELKKLPGVGKYTARAVAAFAFNQDSIVIETNIRTAVIHHFYGHRKFVDDVEIEKVLAQALPKGKSREWYSALMDYGAHLKRSGISHNARSKGYAKQSKFTGSNREARGAILRALVLPRGDASWNTETHLTNLLGLSRCAQVRIALDALLAEGLVKKRGRTYSLPH